MYELNDYSAGINLRLPDPQAIPDAKIRAALEKLIDAQDRVVRSRLEKEAASRALLDAESADTLRGTELNDEGKDDDDPLLLQTPAGVELKKAEARVKPSENARAIAYRELRETIAARREDWQKASRKHAEAARDKLALALRSVELQSAELGAHLGVLELLFDENLPTHLHASWGHGAPETSLAIQHLDAAVVAVDRQVRAL